jgi:succinate-semialdehyde dehydrogenase / glutarate-semialdehyde dehydrogenase
VPRWSTRGVGRVYHEELFGPVAVVYRVADDEAAIALAGDSLYDLGGAVFADDPDRARRALRGFGGRGTARRATASRSAAFACRGDEVSPNDAS